MRNSMQLMAAVVLAAVLVTGCATGSSGPADRKAGQDEAGRAAETGQVEKQPAAKPVEQRREPVREKAAANDEQAEDREQPSSAPAQEPALPHQPEKPLLIVSENLVFADTDQLLMELDKELEMFLGVLESAGEIPDNELNF